LRRVVGFMTVLLKVPQEVSGTQAVSATLVVLLVRLKSYWSYRCLHPDVACWLFYGWDGCC
jgi:hypothetical protein